ncbi:hypothetical protein HGRIS_010835 [Hohenbuehelia grisea]|uniref:F-box domain-containing protein n=1 Tax=Hohenbuehelia grisea TaxID=104357 RepID=A0ABR3IYS1_9AGAR
MPWMSFRSGNRAMKANLSQDSDARLNTFAERPQTFSRSFPPDILVEMAEILPLARDVLSFSLTAKSYFSIIYPVIFTNLELISFEDCQDRLHLLIARPSYARHVKQLVLRPNHLRPLSSQALVDEDRVSRAVELLAPNLQALETFIWDGSEAPMDRVWVSLRQSCPRLSYIGTTIGSRPINQHSALFTFKDLIGFSLIPKDYGSKLHGQDESIICTLPPQFWSMLINDSPNLTFLALGAPHASTYSQLIDGRPATQGRWPRLQMLVLGRTVMNRFFADILDFGEESDDDSQAAAPTHAGLRQHNNTKKLDAETRNWAAFMSYHLHKELKSLTLSYPDLYPQKPLRLLSTECDVPTQCRKSIECAARDTLSAFHGTFHAFFGFNPVNTGITQLDLSAEKLAPFLMPYVRRSLKELPELRAFGIWIDFSPDQFRPATEASRIIAKTEGTGIPEQEKNEIDVIRDIMKCCPRLERLKLMSSTKSNNMFSTRALHKAFLPNPSALISLEVWKISRLLDEPMINTAARLARTLPNLQQIFFRYSSSGIVLRQTGTYDVVRARVPLSSGRSDSPLAVGKQCKLDGTVDINETPSSEAPANPAATTSFPKAILLRANESRVGMLRLSSRKYIYRL